MYLSEIKIVDLEHSDWDKEKSNREKGEYVFRQKEYIDYSTRTRRPPWFFTWVLNTPHDNYKDVRDHKIKWGFTYVTTDDPYWPEGLEPVNGHYEYGDVVLMKCPLINELRRREVARKMSDAQAMSTIRAYNERSREYGVALSSRDEEMIENLVESYLKT